MKTVTRKIVCAVVIAVLLLTGFPVETYQAGTAGISWLLTPATVCLALPLYEQLKILKKNLTCGCCSRGLGGVLNIVLTAGSKNTYHHGEGQQQCENLFHFSFSLQ